MAISGIDVVGLGANATDTVIRVPHFPAPGGKACMVSSSVHAGGQIATALVTCQRLGLRTRYIGKLGDDPGGRIQLASLRKEGLDLRHIRIARRTPNQIAYIVVDKSTGERTVFWDRHPRLAIKSSELSQEAFRGPRALLLDGCDVEACITAARWSREQGIPVVADFDTVYKKVEKLFPFINYLIASADFLPTLIGDADPFRALKYMARKFHIPVAGMTLGRDGTLVLWRGHFHYSPGFVVKAFDTTGAGDVFHGGFVYGLISGWPMPRILDFSNALAALNCMALGARGGIGTRVQAERLMKTCQRRVNPDYRRTAI